MDHTPPLETLLFIRSMFSFATNSFSMEENYLLSKMFKDKFGIFSEIKPIQREAGIQYNLIISEESIENFQKLISKLI
jgi:hypothetical protein